MEAISADIISLRSWLIQIDISTTTAWQWRRDGILKTINIHGRAYVTRQAREEFLARAEAGEFAQEPVNPVGQRWPAGSLAVVGVDGRHPPP